MKKLFLTLTAVFSLFANCFNASAQEEEGLVFGLGIHMLGRTVKNSSASQKCKMAGVSLNGAYAMPIADNLFFMPGLGIVLNGTTRGLYVVSNNAPLYRSGKVDEAYFNIPLHLEYGTHIGDRCRLFFYFGPSAQFGLFSRLRYSTDPDTSAEGVNAVKENLYKNTNYRRFNMLLGGGAGVTISSFRVSIGYDFGVLNRNSSGDASIRDAWVGLKLGYVLEY